MMTVIQGRQLSSVVVCTCDGCAEVEARPASRRFTYLPQEIPLITVPCSRALDPRTILKLLLEGHESVFVVGCAESGGQAQASNYEVEKRLMILRNMIHQASLSMDRVQFRWYEGDCWEEALPEFYEPRGVLVDEGIPELGGEPAMSGPLMLKTNGDPLGSTRDFLEGLWTATNLDGIVIPMADEGSKSVEVRLVEDASEMELADPFAPVMTANTAKVAAQLSSARPRARVAVILRPCEARAFDALLKRNGGSLGDWLLVGIECACTFPSKDYGWRLEKAGSAEALTREVVRFSVRGGIAPYRFRRACQSCSPELPPGCEVRLGVIGVPAEEFLLVSLRDDRLADRLVESGVLEEGLGEGDLARRDRQMIKLSRQRDAVRERMVSSLGSGQPRDTKSFIEKLVDCQPCNECLQVCPAYIGVPEAGLGEAPYGDEITAWLSSCAQCGMCEEVCPDQVPLTAIHNLLLQRAGVEAIVG